MAAQNRKKKKKMKEEIFCIFECLFTPNPQTQLLKIHNTLDSSTWKTFGK